MPTMDLESTVSLGGSKFGREDPCPAGKVEGLA